MKVLLITTEWQSQELPYNAAFLHQEVGALKKRGIEVDVFHFVAKKSLSNYLAAWVKLRKLLRRENYDLIHAHWGQSAILALPKKIPLVVTHRGGDLEGIVDENGKITLQGRLLRFISQFVGLLADKVIIVSGSLAKYLWVKEYIVLPVCLDTELFKPMDKRACRERLGLDNKAKIILFPSDPSRVEKRFWLAEEACKQCSIPNELLVLQNIPHDQMPLYMNAANALIITSKYEGSPTVVFEALACNLPIVSVDVGDVKSRISVFEGCVVCENDEPESVSKGIDYVLHRDERLESSTQMQEFNAEKFANEMINIYKEVLNV